MSRDLESQFAQGVDLEKLDEAEQPVMEVDAPQPYVPYHPTPDQLMEAQSAKMVEQESLVAPVPTGGIAAGELTMFFRDRGMPKISSIRRLH